MERANKFITDVLQYQTPEPSLSSRQAIQASLPYVSVQFVVQNALMSAVADGVLNLIENDTGLNHTSSLPKAAEPGAILP